MERILSQKKKKDPAISKDEPRGPQQPLTIKKKLKKKTNYNEHFIV